ncbi:hypothetical protein HC891_19945, partial [Candidatus Gracilibacteria bacterium]|nr:hypothetical protein [Candidatus Gracilibacteria bacterium]
IVLGGLASIWSEPPSQFHYDYFDYLDRVARSGGWQYVDIIAIHPYRPDAPEGDAWRRDQSLTFRQEMLRLDEILLTYGAKPVWLTELGWSTSSRWPGVDQDTQAFFLVRSFLQAIAHPSIEKVFWYDFRNDTRPGANYERPVYDDGEVEFHYGLLRRSYPLDPNRADLRKPAFLAYRTMTQMLAGLNLQEVARDGYATDAPGVHWFRFAGMGRRVDVLYRTGENAATLTINCACREALIRSWRGELVNILYTDDGNIQLHLPDPGAPMYIEFDPPAQRSQVFPATGHSLGGAFAAYWNANGGLARFGYPLTEELIEPEVGSGRPRVVQYLSAHASSTSPSTAVPLRGATWAPWRRRTAPPGVDWQREPRVGGAPSDASISPRSATRSAHRCALPGNNPVAGCSSATHSPRPFRAPRQPAVKCTLFNTSSGTVSSITPISAALRTRSNLACSPVNSSPPGSPCPDDTVLCYEITFVVLLVLTQSGVARALTPSGCTRHSALCSPGSPLSILSPSVVCPSVLCSFIPLCSASQNNRYLTSI